MMLDEIDKLGAGGFHGDPSAALLEVLDPEQNATFRDAYLGVPFDLSRGAVHRHRQHAGHRSPGRCATGWRWSQLSGYTEEEKLEIARRYLVPRQLERERAAAGAGRDHRRGAARDHPRLHARGRRAQSRARDRRACSATSRCASPRAQPEPVRDRRGRPARDPRAAAASSTRWPMRASDAGRRDRAGVDAGRRRHPVHREQPRCPAAAS